MSLKEILNLKKVIGEVLPNLDAINDENELLAIKIELREISNGLRLLSSYAEGKGNAVECRKAGKIESVLRFEVACGFVYAKLPSWIKW